MKYSKFIIVFIILSNIVFASIVLFIFWRTGFEPSALIVAWFAFTTGELWALSRIKVEEERRKRDEFSDGESQIYKEATKKKKY